jgi:cytochrome P450
MWVVTRYDDVRGALQRDGTVFSAVGQTSRALGHLTAEQHQELESLERLFSAGLLWSDPPDHTRIRSVVNKALTPLDAERMRPAVELIVRAQVAALPRKQCFDLVEMLAEPVPVVVLAALMGIPGADVPRFRGWAQVLAAFLGTPRPDAELAVAAQKVVAEAGDFIGWLRRERAEEPGDDVVSRLVTLEQAGNRLGADEFTATVIVLLVGGHRTTTALISNSVLALASSPDQLQALREQKIPVARAVEEFLRFESPHQRTLRIARQDTLIGDRLIAEGDVVALLNGSANRDESRFSEADRLLLDRHPNRHLALAEGIHFCLGAPVARMEAAIVIDALVNRVTRLETVDARPTWLENYTLRALTNLNVMVA